MARYFTADLHVDHANIIRYCDRPFVDVDHMLAVIESNWRSRIGDDDTVYLLGDVALGGTEHGLERISMLPGHKILVPGNHDKCWPGDRRHPTWTPRYEAAGLTVADVQLRIELGGEEVTLCHFPPTGDSRDDGDRFARWRPAADSWVVHGHVHDRWKVNGTNINVGVDVWDFAPVHEDTLAAIIAGR